MNKEELLKPKNREKDIDDKEILKHRSKEIDIYTESKRKTERSEK